MILSDSMNQFQENEEKGVTDKPFIYSTGKWATIFLTMTAKIFTQK